MNALNVDIKEIAVTAPESRGNVQEAQRGVFAACLHSWTAT